jgi:hypothetical protein
MHLGCRTMMSGTICAKAFASETGHSGQALCTSIAH